MRIFVTGASGFIGSRLAAALRARGHEVVGAGRAAQALPQDQRVDFTTDFDPAVWERRLRGIDVLVNAVGILRERGPQTFDALHRRAPQALFAGAVAAGVRRIVQLSALGADEDARSRYHLSKKAADDFLAVLPVEWVVVQPSLVFGPGGASAKLFATLASLPWVPVPGKGAGLVQPVHIDDVIEALVAVIETPSAQLRRVHLAGPGPVSLGEFLLKLRGAMGMRPTSLVRIPRFLMRLGAALAAPFPSSPLDRETLGMLERGNTTDPAATRELLGREPRAIESFVPDTWREGLRLQSKLQWLLPPLRWSVALVWIVTGVVSLGVYPTDQSYALLARTGVPAVLMPLALYGAAALDLALGIGTLLLRRRQMLWLVQIAVIAGYTVIISLRLPEFWLHPYGPILKNVPLLAAIWMLYGLDRPGK